MRGKIFLVLIFILLINFSAAARLPVVGADADAWGELLNAFLNVSHDAGGFLRNINNSVNGFTNITGNLEVSENISVPLICLNGDCQNSWSVGSDSLWTNSSGSATFLGNVGIGTTSPNESLSIIGNQSVSGRIVVGSLGKLSSEVHGSVAVWDNKTTLSNHAFEDYSELSELVSSVHGYASYDANPTVQAGSISHYVGFQSRPKFNSTGNITEYFDSINSLAYNLNSGTVQSMRGLHIMDAVNSGGGQIIENYGIKIENIAVGNSNYAIHSSGGSVFLAGNVALGEVNNSGSKLQINDPIHFLRFYETDGTTNKRMYGFAGVTDQLRLTARTDAGNLIRDLIVFTHDGNIGINTTTPQNTLNVVGDLNVTGTIYGTVSSSNVWTNDSNNISYILGNVGIGTTTPGTLLHVNHSSSGQTPINVSGLFVENSGSSNSFYVFQTATSVGKSFSITNAGNVGIGTTAPAYNLVVADTTNPRILISDSENDSNDNSELNLVNAFSGWSIYNEGNSGTGDLRFYNYGDKVTFENGTGNVGIGTTTPQNKLNVVGDLNVTGTIYGTVSTSEIWNRSSTNVFLTNTGDNVGIGINSPTSKLHLHSALGNSSLTFSSNVASWFHIYEPFNTSQLRFSTGGGEIGTKDIMTFSSGNVGIGTTSPSRILHVSGTEVETSIPLFEGISNSGQKIFSFKRSDLSQEAFLNYTGFSWILGTANTGDIRFNQNGVYTLFVEGTNGNVGIGIDSPSYRLHVLSNLYNSGENFVGQFGANDSSTGIVLGYRANGTTGTGAIVRSYGNMPLYLGTTGTPQALNILNAGNVGIGTTSPTQKFEVVGTSAFRSLAAADSAIQLINSNNSRQSYFAFVPNGTLSSSNVQWTLRTAASSNNFEISTYDGSTVTQRLYLKNTGEVGIGTINPSAKLHIGGATDAAGTFDASTATFIIGDFISGKNTIRFYTDNTNNITAIQSTQYGLTTRPLVLNPAGGNVGIGTISPEGKLHILADSVTPTLSGSSAEMIISANSPQLFFDEADGSADNQLWDILADGGIFRMRAVNDSNTVGTSWLQTNRTGTTINSVSFPNGNVGIGTSSPGNLLTVASSSTTGPLVSINSTQTNGRDWWLTSVGSAGGSRFGHFEIQDRQGLNFFTIVNNTGNVGIGTTTPGSKLTIKQTSDASDQAIYVQNAAGTDTGIIYMNGGIFTFQKGSNANQLVLDASGNVGIGTTTPQNTLNVVGDLNVTTEVTVGGVSGSGKVVCVKSDGFLGVCSTNISATGTCTCG